MQHLLQQHLHALGVLKHHLRRRTLVERVEQGLQGGAAEPGAERGDGPARADLHGGGYAA